MSSSKFEKAVTIAFCVTGLAIFALMGISFVAKCLGGVDWKYSEGTRSGVVQKVSKKGLIWQTWEGELNLGYNTSTASENGGTTISPEIFQFSCSSNEVAKQLQDAEVKGGRVTLEYTQYMLRGWKYGQTQYDITGVTFRQ